MYQLSMDRKDENFPESTARYTVAVAKFESSFLIITQIKLVSEEGVELNGLSDTNVELYNVILRIEYTGEIRKEEDIKK
jgi:hypothetical protein